MIKRIITIAKKEAILIWRDKLSMLILIALPAVVIAVLGGVLSFEPDNTKFYVLDNDRSVASKQFIENLSISPEFDLAGYIFEEKELEAIMESNHAKIVVVIHNGFEKDTVSEESMVDVFVDASDLLFSMAMEQTIKGMFFNNKSINYSFEFNEGLNKQVQTLPGLVMIVFIIISSVMLSLSVNRERERGTSRLLSLTPISINGIIVGKMIPYIIISLFYSLSVLLISKWLYGIDASGSHFLFFIMCLIFIINSMCFGLVIAAWVKSEIELLIGCWLILFTPNVFFSGFIYPIETMELVTRSIASILPGSLFIESYKGIVFRNSGLVAAYPYFIILSIQSVIIYILAKIGFDKNFTRK